MLFIGTTTITTTAAATAANMLNNNENDAVTEQMMMHEISSSSTEMPSMDYESGGEDDEAAYLNQLSDDDYIDFVANFLKPTPIEWAFVAIFLALMVVGVCGNCLVVYVVSRNRHMWTSMNLFLTNLALSDLLVLIFCLPPTVLNDITKTFWLSQGFCKAMLFVQNTSVYVSVLTLVAISLERWRAISRPLSRRAFPPFVASSKRRTCQVVALIWLVAAFLSLPEPFTLRTFPAEYARANLSTKWGTRCKESWSPEFQQRYQLVQTVALFITPLLVISTLCVHMNIVLRRQTESSLQVNGSRHFRHLRERQRAMRMLITVVLVFAISYLPVHLHNIATAFQLDHHWGMDEQEQPSLVLIALRKFVPRVMSYGASVINPIAYNFMSEKFRKEFRRACCGGFGVGGIGFDGRASADYYQQCGGGSVYGVAPNDTTANSTSAAGTSGDGSGICSCCCLSSTAAASLCWWWCCCCCSGGAAGNAARKKANNKADKEQQWMMSRQWSSLYYRQPSSACSTCGPPARRQLSQQLSSSSASRHHHQQQQQQFYGVGNGGGTDPPHVPLARRCTTQSQYSNSRATAAALAAARAQFI